MDSIKVHVVVLNYYFNLS